MFAIYAPIDPIDESHRTVSGCRQSLVGMQRDRFRVVDHKVLTAASSHPAPRLLLIEFYSCPPLSF